MPFLPRNITSLVGSDPTTTKVNNNLRQAVQPTLDFLNTYMQAGADGTLRFLRNVVMPKLNVAGLTQLSALTVSGLSSVLPTTNGTAFYVANVGATSIVFSVDANGNVAFQGTMTGGVFISANGFKCVIYMGTFWNSAITANTFNQTYHATINTNGGGNGTTPAFWKFTHPGSLVGISYTQAGPVSGNNLISYYKNGNLLTSYTIGASSGSTVTFSKQEPKALYPFAQNDALTLQVGCSAAGNFQATVYATVELST